ncbi:MAG: LysR family transcriptional regulator [Gordonibacter sp.]|uniref:LysR family transcriptional regulator n=1 Tax=Gordonibacter sp. TaxID=1968902 RepID=UPI002FC8A746
MLDLEMRHLEYLVAAATAGSYAQAAKQLFVSPQAVSKGVQVLEGRIGIALFDRGPHGIALTAFGETFCKEARAILKALERLQDMTERQLLEYNSSLSVGIHSLCFQEHGGTIAWDDLLNFHESYKAIAPSFVEMRGDSIIASIASGTLDFGIGVLPSDGSDFLEGTLLKRFPLAALVSSKSSCFAQQNTVTIEELAHSQLVQLSEDQEFNNFFIEKSQDEQLPVNISPLQMRADSDIDVVINRELYAVRPYQHALRMTKGDNIRILPIVDRSKNPIKMPLSLFWKKGKELSLLEKSFVEMISNSYR